MDSTKTPRLRLPFQTDRIIIQAELTGMSEFLRMVKEGLEAYQESVFNQWEEEASKLPEEVRDLYWDEMYDELGLVRDAFPRLMYSQFVVSWYSFVEQELVKACRRVGGDLETGKGSVIKKAYRCICRETGYAINQKQWQELCKVNTIRNHIVHKGNRIPFCHESKACQEGIRVELRDGVVYLQEIKKHLYRYMQSEGIISLWYINPTYEYCQHLIELSQQLFNDTYEEVSKVTREKGTSS